MVNKEFGNEPYASLASAIIMSAFNDLNCKEESEKLTAVTFFRSDYFETLAYIVGLSDKRIGDIRARVGQVCSGVVSHKTKSVQVGRRGAIVPDSGLYRAASQ